METSKYENSLYSQHAFFHLEKHLDKTPNEYIQWRYSSGEDREKVEEEKTDLTKEKYLKMKMEQLRRV